MEIAVRVARRIAARLFGGVAHRGRLIAVLVILAGGLIAVTGLDLLPRINLRLPNGSASQPRTTNEPEATADYLRGQQTSDAQLVWESYSDRVIQNLQSIGITVDDTQRQLDRARDAGSKIDQVQYIGGSTLPTGSMQFYLVTRSGRSTKGPSFIPYTFTLDDKGKIDRVE